MRPLFQANGEGGGDCSARGWRGDVPRGGGFRSRETMEPIQIDFSLIGDSANTFLTRNMLRKKLAKGSTVIRKVVLNPFYKVIFLKTIQLGKFGLKWVIFTE